MLSFGVPFFHRGQEIGLSKYGDMNSYRSSDKVNQFAYALASKRKNHVHYFQDLTKMRKECLFLHEDDPEKIKKLVTFKDLDRGGVMIEYHHISRLSPYKTFKVFINISDEPIFVELENAEKIILNQAGYIAGKASDLIHNLMVSPQSIIITGLRKD
jgi:pullulanase